jgi:hypothetical protein
MFRMQCMGATQQELPPWDEEVSEQLHHFPIATDVFQSLAANDLVKLAAQAPQIIDVHPPKLHSVLRDSNVTK